MPLEPPRITAHASRSNDLIFAPLARSGAGLQVASLHSAPGSPCSAPPLARSLELLRPANVHDRRHLVAQLLEEARQRPVGSDLVERATAGERCDGSHVLDPAHRAADLTRQ